MAWCQRGFCWRCANEMIRQLACNAEIGTVFAGISTGEQSSSSPSLCVVAYYSRKGLPAPGSGPPAETAGGILFVRRCLACTAASGRLLLRNAEIGTVFAGIPTGEQSSSSPSLCVVAYYSRKGLPAPGSGPPAEIAGGILFVPRCPPAVAGSRPTDRS